MNYSGQQGTYISLSVVLPHPLHDFLTKVNAKYEREYDPHVTLIYDRDNADLDLLNHVQPGLSLRGRIKDFEFWDGHDNDGYFVAHIDCPLLQTRHKFWLGRGLKHSFDDYVPHCTFGSKDAAINVRDVFARPDVTKRWIGSPVLLRSEAIANCRD